MAEKLFYGRPVPRIELESGTWLDGEELAYNTYSGTPNGSGRKGRAKCFDGKLRTFSIGIPDTFFSIPAVGKLGSRYVRGWVEVKGGVLLFHRQTRYKNDSVVGTTI
jgi:hypothetical protein